MAAPRAAPAADAKALYIEALRDFKALTEDKKAGERRDNWLALDARFSEVHRADPSGETAPKALFYLGWINEELARRSFLKKDYQAAADLYKRMADRFPRHEWADDALLRRAEIEAKRLDAPRAARDDLAVILRSDPPADKAPAARELLAAVSPNDPLLRIAPARAPAPLRPEPQGAPPREPAQAVPPTAQAAPVAQADAPRHLPAATPEQPAVLQAIETEYDNGGVRVVLRLDRETTYRYQILDPENKKGGETRLYVDLDNVTISQAVRPDAKTPDNLVSRIRTAYNRPGVVRVVVDLRELADRKVYSLDSPFRVNLDLRGTSPPVLAAQPEAPAQAPPEARTQAQAAFPAPEPPAALAPTTADDASGKSRGPRFSDWLKNLFEPKKPADKTVASTSAKNRKDSAAKNEHKPDPEPAKPAAKTPPAQEYVPPPGSNKRVGDLVEQLGLTVKTIMVDAGHGGKDPGAQGASGLVEKDVNLRFAKILGKKLKEHGFNVEYTRTGDAFISLENRTEAANAKKADLFLSVHCNAHNDPNTSGLETYSLNLARTEDAVRVAARENAASSKQISDLQFILTDLMLNSKIKESRDLAKTVQSQAMDAVEKRYGARDRGPHEAPFYVLMGAKMPAVLVELGYITNKKEAKRLASDAYLESLAQGLVDGVIAYKKRIERFAGVSRPKT